MRYLILAVLLAASPAQAQRACTQIGCMDGLVISTPLEYRWQPGNYVFDIMIDGASMRCTGALPLASCDQPSLTCEGKGAMITESGCALPASEHGFGDIMIASGPQRAKVRIAREGDVIAQGEWTPDYQTSSHNGPECGPVCRQATVKLEMLR